MGGPRRCRVVSIACAYPSPGAPGLGIFVRHRLFHLAAELDAMVIAPLPYFRYGGGGIPRPATAEEDSRDGSLEVKRPRWFHPPLAGGFNSIFLFAFLFPVVAGLRRKRMIDVLDAQFGHPEAGAAALLGAVFGLPFTVTLRGSEMIHARNRRTRWMLSWAFRRAARVIGVSEELRRFAVSMGVPEERTRVIPNGVDTAVFHARDRDVCRERWGFGPDPVVFMAGNLIELKGHATVIRAIASIRRRIPCVLKIAGRQGLEPAYERRLRELISQLGLTGVVEIEGQCSQSDLAEKMAACDLFCLASRSEGWPNVVNEALACGAPVVAFGVGAVPELLPRPELGIVVPPGDDALFENAVEKALGRQWDRITISAWGTSRSWKHVAAEFAHELDAVRLASGPLGGVK